MEEKQKTSGILWLVTLFLFLHTLLSFGASLASSAGDTLLGFCLHILSYLLPGVLLMRTQQTNGVLPKRPTGNLRAALPLFPILLAAMILLSSLTALLLGVFGIGATGGAPSGDLASAFIYDCFMPAVLEEVLFRFALLPLLFYTDRENAVWVNALLFALIHPSLYQIPYAFCGGIILALTWQIAGRNAAVLFHLLNNLCALLLSLGEAWGGLPFNIASLSVIALLAVFSAVWLVRRRREACYAPIAAFFSHRTEETRTSFAALLSPIGLWCILAFSLTLLNTLF